MSRPSPNPFIGFFDELTEKFGAKEFAEQVAKLDETASKQLDGILEQMSKTELEQTRTLIETRRGLISTNPAYGNEIISISKQILAFGGAGIGLAAASIQRLAEMPLIILKLVGIASIFYLNMMLLSLCIIFLFAWQARIRYPFLYFRQIGNTIPFFYYQAISPLTPRSFFQTAKEKLFAAELYAADLISFLNHQIPNKTAAVAQEETVGAKNDKVTPAASGAEIAYLRKLMKDEVQQYFLLVAYQGYVNQYEVKMNNVFLYGLLGSVTATVGVAFLALA